MLATWEDAVESQLTELTNLQGALVDLERSHITMKKTVILPSACSLPPASSALTSPHHEDDYDAVSPSLSSLLPLLVLPALPLRVSHSLVFPPGYATLLPSETLSAPV